MSHHHQHVDVIDELFLVKPNTEKELEHGTSFGFAAIQGWRSSAEDFHNHLIPFDNHSWKLWSYFAIFDGHNGTDTARNAANLLPVHLLDPLNQMLHYDNADAFDQEKPVHSSQLNLNHFRAAVKETYFKLDKDLRKVVKDHSGCVCVTCLIGPENIYLINIGDSRAIIISKDGQVLTTTIDHKPDIPEEQKRILKAGGTISKPSADDVLRVEDQLAMTRVIGDFAFDKHIVPPMADIFECSRKSPASFVILACDGIWDVMSNEEVASFVCKRAATTKLEDIASQLLDECLEKGSTDNMSVYIVSV